MGRIKRRQDMLHEIEIDKLVHGGQGLGLLADGRKCFVWGALPGETVQARVIKSKKTWAEALAVEIIKSSKDRVEPIEPEMYLSTSPWQILDYPKEAQFKQQILTETFLREGIGIDWQEFYQQDRPFGYRNKMEYNFWFDNETSLVSLALHRRGSHLKIAVEGSQLASPAINEVGKLLLEFINQNGIEARPLKSAIIRSTQDGLVGLSLFIKDKSVADKFAVFASPNIIFEIIYSDPNSPASIFTDMIKPTEQYLSDNLLGIKFLYSTRSFFQVNLPVYERALAQIKENVKNYAKHSVLDLYSGVGSIGLTVTPESDRLTLVETESSCTDVAKLNINSKERVTIITADAEKALDYITGREVVILDPPRAGLHKAVTTKLLDASPPKIIYLSCNPSTQARDARLLVEGGYKISFAQGYNFFPRTPHIESLIIITK